MYPVSVHYTFICLNYTDLFALVIHIHSFILRDCCVNVQSSNHCKQLINTQCFDVFVLIETVWCEIMIPIRALQPFPYIRTNLFIEDKITAYKLQIATIIPFNLGVCIRIQQQID